MKRIKFKSAMFGFIVGVLTMSTVTAFGLAYASGKVEAWVQDKQIKIMVDGEYVTLPEDMHVLNYNNRIYTPTRLVAEQLGATVEWEDARQAVIITPAEPKVIEVPKEVEKETEEKESEKNSYYYSPLPIKKVNRLITMNITSMEMYHSQSDIYMDFKNDSQHSLMFLENQTYIEYDGKKYPIREDYQRIFADSVDPWAEMEEVRLIFEPLPIDADKIKVNIAIKIYNGIYSDDPGETVHYEFYIDPTDEPYYDYYR